VNSTGKSASNCHLKAQPGKMAGFFYMEDQLVKLQAILTVKMPSNFYIFTWEFNW
jgi:hypothetical protein